MRKVLAETSVEDLKSYMELHVINAYAGFLSDAFTDRAFEASKVINGVQEQQPRWKRAVATISGSLGETIGKLYVKEYFPETSNFPAAILQPPFFDPEADYVCNYGAIGAVIGHEMTHGFDDQGCQFDKDGNLANWWTAEDKARYDERTKVIADWFSEQEAVPGLKVNGQKTLGENVSDNGGLKIAYRAYKNRMASEPLGDVDGFTPAQRFYLAYARVWACNSTPEYTAMLVNSDVHSPARLRVMAALPMIDTWYEAFGIQPTDKMFIPKEKRALVW